MSKTINFTCSKGIVSFVRPSYFWDVNCPNKTVPFSRSIPFTIGPSKLIHSDIWGVVDFQPGIVKFVFFSPKLTRSSFSTQNCHICVFQPKTQNSWPFSLDWGPTSQLKERVSFLCSDDCSKFYMNIEYIGSIFFFILFFVTIYVNFAQMIAS